MDDQDSAIRTIATAIALFITPAAFFSAPLLKYANAGWLSSMGTMLGLGLATAWLTMRFEVKPVWKWLPSTLLSFGFVGLLYQSMFAGVASVNNDIRCANIQREMLLPHPRRSDLPSLFSAFGCRPQGDDDVQLTRSAGPPRPKPVPVPTIIGPRRAPQLPAATAPTAAPVNGR